MSGDDSDKLIDSDPDAEAVEEPTTSESQEADATKWMLKEAVSLGVISILMVVLLALALMQAGGVIDVMEPFADAESTQWIALAVLALAGVGVFVWSRVGV